MQLNAVSEYVSFLAAEVFWFVVGLLSLHRADGLAQRELRLLHSINLAQVMNWFVCSTMSRHFSKSSLEQNHDAVHVKKAERYEWKRIKCTCSNKTHTKP